MAFVRECHDDQPRMFFGYRSDMVVQHRVIVGDDRFPLTEKVIKDNWVLYALSFKPLRKSVWIHLRQQRNASRRLLFMHSSNWNTFMGRTIDQDRQQTL